MAGAFVTFEGGEGTGKSTQAHMLVERLGLAGVRPVLLREPGGTPVGDVVRACLLDPEHLGMDPMAELFLYEASRRELAERVIRPALEHGKLVVCDRFADSSTAYQGYGRGIPVKDVLALNERATGGLVPDLTVLLDVDPVIGLERATGAGADRLEREDLAFHERVRAGFLALASTEPGRFAVLDASVPAAQVAAAVWAAAEPRLRSLGVLD